MDLVRHRITFDMAGRACAAPALTAADRPAQVLLLQRDFDVVGHTAAELIALSRQYQPAVADFQLADYWPNYLQKLTSDLEAGCAEGRTVYLWGAQGQLHVVGYAASATVLAPLWTDTEQWFTTARDALHSIAAVTRERRP